MNDQYIMSDITLSESCIVPIQNDGGYISTHININPQTLSCECCGRQYRLVSDTEMGGMHAFKG